MPSNANNTDTGDTEIRTHVEHIDDASGCTEAWLQLSIYRHSERREVR